MTDKALLACLEPRETKWQLNELLPAGAGDVVLFGWNIGPEVDGGMPAEVGAVIAEALTSVARVTFQRSRPARTASAEWTTEDGDEVRTLPDKNLANLARTAFGRAPSGINMVSTRRPESAAALFHDGDWPWQLQGQLVLLSPPDAAPPAIDRDTLVSVFNGEWNGHVAELRAMGVAGVLRPGVDGDVFAVLFLTHEHRDAVLEAFALHAQRAGYAWLQLAEEAFTDASSGPIPGFGAKGPR